jgi:hypothetical protein
VIIPISSIKDPKDRLVAFVKERQNIYERRMAGQPKPWTDDQILQSYRFANIIRENDIVTIWIADNWRSPNVMHCDLWFAMTVARLVNEPLTLAEIGFPVLHDDTWARKGFKSVITKRRSKGLRAYGAAYMLTTSGRTIPKVDYHVEMLDWLWRARKILRPQNGDTLRSYHTLLGQMYGLSTFLAAQVIADLKFAKGTPLEKASDWMTFAASGPGSRRGLCRIHDESITRWKERSEERWWNDLIRLRNDIMPKLKGTALYETDAQTTNAMLCEWDKYERARLGEGVPKQRYNGRE